MTLGKIGLWWLVVACVGGVMTLGKIGLWWLVVACGGGFLPRCIKGDLRAFRGPALPDEAWLSLVV